MIAIVIWDSATWTAFAALLVAALILDAFDISLPRGDSIGVSGAISVATLSHLGFAPAVVVSIAAPFFANWRKDDEGGPGRIAPLIVSRCVALGAATLVLGLGGSAVSGSGVWIVQMAVPACYFLVEFLAMQCALAMVTGRPFTRLLRGALGMQAPLVAAQWSAAVLLLLIYPSMGMWSVVPVVILLLLMRQSAALLLQIREAYKTTVEVLVEAAESQQEGRVGHSERTAFIARGIATKIGMTGQQVEHISYAALLHDLDALNGDVHDSADSCLVPSGVSGHSSSMLEAVEFFSDVLPIVKLCDGIVVTPVADSDVLSALVVALANDIDALEDRHAGALHKGQMFDRVSLLASPAMKSRAISAAILLGHATPSVT